MRSWVCISRSRLKANWRAVREAVGAEVEVAAVVKANAYGHGAAEVSRVLEEEGARWLAVSSVEEGVALRTAGRQSQILVMAGFLPYEREALLEFALTPAIHSLEEIRALDQLGRPVTFHLKIDTGLTRLGTRAAAAEILATVSALKTARLTGLMTHCASPADFSSMQTRHQLERFDAMTAALAAGGVRPALVHAASTNAIAYGRRPADHNMVRPGHALYGYVSPARGDAPRSLLSVKPALEWKTRILEVKEIAENTLVGYGATFRAPRPMRIGVLALGYADGLPHRLSNKGRVLAGGRPAAILGTVSMDLTTIDLGNAPSLGTGDEVTILGEDGEARQDAQQIARMAGTISYAVLCGIGERVHRVYID